MSVHTIHNRNNGIFLEVPSSQKSSSLSGVTHSSQLKLPLKSDMSECKKDDPLLRAACKIRDLNSTYVISACKTTGDTSLTINPTSKLTLQRRATRSKESSLLNESRDTTEKTAETSLTLQRRAKTVSAEKWKTRQNVGNETESNCASQRTRINVKTVNNNPSSFVTSHTQIAEDSKDVALMGDQKYKETFSALSRANENTALKHSSSSSLMGSQDQREAGRPGPLATKLIQSNLNIKVMGTENLHPSVGKDTAKNSSKFGSLDKRTPVKCTTEYKSTPKHDLPHPKSPGTSILKNRTPCFQVKQRPKNSFSSKREISQKNALPIEEETAVQNTSTETDLLKVENSQVTVAVRVRPFSKREKIEKESQVVFMNGEEIIVEHPDMQQAYTFIYDVSFWSFDECHPLYASQMTVYETLAAPLLQRAFEGYNTCLSLMVRLALESHTR